MQVSSALLEWVRYSTSKSPLRHYQRTARANISERTLKFHSKRRPELCDVPVQLRLTNRVLRPAVYFLVLTSIIVHGITIPVGKGFHHAATRTNTQNRSSSNLVGSGVSRLPPAVPLGSKGMTPAPTIDHRSQDDLPPNSTSIRFEEPTMPSPAAQTVTPRRSREGLDTLP